MELSSEAQGQPSVGRHGANVLVDILVVEVTSSVAFFFWVVCTSERGSMTLLTIFDWVIRHWDVLLFLSLATVHVGVWLFGVPDNPKRHEDKAVNQTAGEAMHSATSAGITAASILIPASFVIVQIAKQPGSEPVPPAVMMQVFKASLYFVGSLMLGLFVEFVIPMRIVAFNVVYQKLIGIPFGVQLFALVAGVICLVRGLYLIV